MQSWSTYDSRGRSLYLRPSDGQLVYLGCCFPGCGRTDFKNIRSIMRHVSDMRTHGGGKGFFRNHAHVIEVCGKLPDGQQALREEEEEHRLIEPFPHQEHTAHEPEASVPVSSHSQPPATAYAVEQDFDGLNGPKPRSIRGSPLSDHNSVSSTATMEMHDATIRKEITEDFNGHPHISHTAQAKGTITQDCLSANESERVALPEYISSMRDDTDDDDVDTAILVAVQHQATVRQRYLPELASLDAGQMGSLIDPHSEVQIKREDESIEYALEASNTARLSTLLTQRFDAVENTTSVGEPGVETELADPSISFGNQTLVGRSGVDAGLFDQPRTANLTAVETPETDGSIAHVIGVVGKTEIETEHADASIPRGNGTLVRGSELDSLFSDQPVTADAAAAAAKIQETDGRIGDTTDLGETVANSRQAFPEQLVAHISSDGRARTVGPELCIGVSHKRASSISVALLDTAAQKRWRYNSYTFGPSSC